MSDFIRKAREPVNSLTHLAGAALSLMGLAVLLVVWLCSPGRAPVMLVSALVFGLSLVALYSASGIYHYYSGPVKILARLKKLDHAMIYVLIAGSYTPICLRFMPWPHGGWFLLVIWSIAAAGILAKLCWIGAPRLFSTILYLLMGWAVVFDFSSFAGLPRTVMFLLAAGGVSYTAGGVIYAAKKPNLSKTFGFHELFHLFVLGGSLLHYFAVWQALAA